MTPKPPGRLERVSDAITRIRNARFRPLMLRPGYDMETVDRFLDEVVGMLERDEPVQAKLAGANFKLVRFRTAYRPEDVDAFLQDLAASLP